MTKINENYLKLPGSYLFSTITKKVAEYEADNVGKKIIRLGIGDVTLPLSEAIINALHLGVNDMADAKTFKGYGDEQGYAFLRQRIIDADYVTRGISFDINEVFVSDGAKSDMGNIGDIFDTDNIVAICDPVYPVYVDTNVMSGRAGNLVDGKWDKIVYMNCNEENDFCADLPKEKVDIIYLCYPNNPTGSVIDREALKKWVDYALANESIILYDGAYKSFITQENIPHSIYEIEGAKKCAIEFRSYSKTAGFTGVRCGYTVVPKDLLVNGISLNSLWNRRQTTKFNGVAYIVQKGAEAIYSDKGQEQVKQMVNYYLNNAGTIYNGLKEVGFKVWGGINAPYVWLKTPDNLTSWGFF